MTAGTIVSQVLQPWNLLSQNAAWAFGMFVLGARHKKCFEMFRSLGTAAGPPSKFTGVARTYTGIE